jgi:hypothetical protein
MADYRVTVRFTQLDTDNDPTEKVYDVISDDVMGAAFEAGRMERRPYERRIIAEVISVRGPHDAYRARRMDRRERETLNSPTTRPLWPAGSA